ncbi:alpha-N-arabinofuranosidase [Paenibacillus sp. H1-7]|uniref:glycoside hydrolase family 43 protein n=1 Tax=Paenibacillus sp. H1-7 TaxID=2282849 RepID=UPI001EF78BFC|nr:glycoside hydrolase family 43 protein [Paenibacillus sp. H1-7]ULL16792.1 alpha-N-arabinofuranosidase [Paenibacillus sp. H1-7]
MTRTFRNPLVEKGADPWIYRHTDGFYYFTVTRGNRIDIWKSATISGIADKTPQTVWQAPETGPNCKNIWAPEIHFIQGKWYIYYTANDGQGGKPGDQTRRCYVLENASVDPLSGEWVDKGQIRTAIAGLDGTVLQHRDELYFVYSGYGSFPDYGSALYMVKMSDPWTTIGDEVLLSAPTEAWEKQGGMAINEGPIFLRRNGKLFLIFSASACWSDDYALGMLTASETDDVMNPASWIKHDGPVFAKSVENKAFGPGHNGFTVSPDGTEDWILYHAIPESNGGASLRCACAQKFGWHADGTPDFGIPAPIGSDIPVPSGE